MLRPAPCCSNATSPMLVGNVTHWRHCHTERIHRIYSGVVRQQSGMPTDRLNGLTITDGAPCTGKFSEISEGTTKGLAKTWHSIWRMINRLVIDLKVARRVNHARISSGGRVKFDIRNFRVVETTVFHRICLSDTVLPRASYRYRFTLDPL